MDSKDSPEAAHGQNSDLGVPWRSASGTGLMPLRSTEPVDGFAAVAGGPTGFRDCCCVMRS
ncbi:hypothetical protein HOK021_46640 [Streptomyces hygroscopicus]|nr:hypothetical protein HOK021_46640 [Streptomyces hygroscopicus]